MNRRLRMIALTAAAGIALAASPASAAKITYTVTGNFTGQLNGQTFRSAAATFTGIGDTANVGSFLGNLYIPLSSLTAQSGGQSYDFGNAFNFYSNGLIGGFATGQKSLFTLIGVFGDAATGTTASTPAAFLFGTVNGAVQSGPGALKLTGADHLAFTSMLSGVAAVPEPASWAMMMLGFGAIGAAARRRPRVTTRLAYA